MGDDLSSESEINVDNPELEMLALESKVGHEIGASISTINKNNNIKINNIVLAKKVVGKVINL